MPSLRLVVDRVPGRAVDFRLCRLLGLTGSTALAAGGVTSGALPVREMPAPDSGPAALGLVCAYFGLVVLIAAWALVGAAVRGPRPPGRRDLLLTLVLWAAPLLVAPPLFSRDVYSYLAQGAMVDAQLDVHTLGPSHLGGPLPAEVAPLWRDTPAPYGPVFLALAAVAHSLGAAAFPADQVSTGVLGMRLVALLGVAAMALCLPRLARHCGTDPSVALWLGVLNPLVLLHLVGGAHNDAIMLGLLGVGLVAALGRRPVAAVVLITLAALVKAPAALGLVAVVVLWARQAAWARTPRLSATAAVVCVCAATTAVTTAVAGTGYGWLATLDTPVSPGNWSLTSTLGRMTTALLDRTGDGHGDLARFAGPVWHLLGLAATAVAVLLVWRRHHLLRPVHALGLSLTAVAVLGPAIRPWYLLWGLFLIAAAGPGRRLRRAATAVSAVLALVVLPSGFAPDAAQLGLAVGGGLLAVTALWGADHVARRPIGSTA